MNAECGTVMRARTLKDRRRLENRAQMGHNTASRHTRARLLPLQRLLRNYCKDFASSLS
jgi:hypothetical protein